MTWLCIRPPLVDDMANAAISLVPIAMRKRDLERRWFAVVAPSFSTIRALVVTKLLTCFDNGTVFPANYMFTEM